MKSHSKLNLMEMLPIEVMVEILKRVPAKSVCRIRCVSKNLLSIVDSPSFVKLHSTFLFDPDSHLPPDPPQFMLHYRLSCLYSDDLRSLINIVSTFHSLHYDPSNAQGAPQLNPRLILKSTLHDSSHAVYSLQFVFGNLFCIRCTSNHALGFLINPLRGEVLRLPPRRCFGQQVRAPSCLEAVWHGMGFDSVTNTYRILCVARIYVPSESAPRAESASYYCESQVLVLGTSEWRQVPSPPPDLLFCYFQSICAHGDMHRLVFNYTREGIQGHVHILSFDFKKEEFFWIPNPYTLPDAGGQLHMINYKGSMAIVDTTSATNIEIWVMKDYNKKQWMLDHSINIRMLELDSEFKFRQASCCEWEHGILFMAPSSNVPLFLDLRGPVVTKNLFGCPYESFEHKKTEDSRRIMSFYGSLISLKSYANLEEAEEPATYCNWSEGVASGKNFFYLTQGNTAA